MEIIITKSELSRILGIVQSVAAKKPTMPILYNILLTAEDGSFSLAATDLEISVRATAKAEVIKRGSTTLNAKVLSDLVRELPEGDVNFKLTEGERVEIHAAKSRFKMIGICSDSYPILKGLGLELTGSIKTFDLRELIKKSIYAVSLDDNRVNLNGLCLELEDGPKKEKLLKFVATDGHRLSLISRPVKGLKFSGRVIVPRKGLAEIRRLVEATEESEIGIDIRDGFLILQLASSNIAVSLVDAEYPSYEHVISKVSENKIKVNTDLLVPALRRVALMVSDKGKGVRLDLSQDLARISSSSPELGEAFEEIEVSYSGEPLSLGFNALYIIDFSESLGEPAPINFDISGDLGVIKLSYDDEPTYYGIVMPMRLDS